MWNPLSLVVSLALLCAGCEGMNGRLFGAPVGNCGTAQRLVPDFTENNPGGPDYIEYAANGTQFDAICLPEAWRFMRDRWQGPAIDEAWPTMVVIDDGFFPSDDSGIRPKIRPGYPDGSGTDPNGSAWGDDPPAGQVASYGHHGTAVLSLMSSRTNNGFLLSGACGPWLNKEGGNEWGARFLPVRIGRGFVPPPSPSLLVPIFDEVVFSLAQIRVVNISKTLIELNLPDGSDIANRLAWADARQVIVVTGAGNTRANIPDDAWARGFDNVVVVGALNPSGDDLWIVDQTTGTASGPGIDLYAPGQDLDVIEKYRSVVTDSGTSYAAPLVSCAAAMVLNVEPTLDPWVVREILVKTGESIVPTSGGAAIRRLNAYRAVACAEAVQYSTTPGGTGLARVQSWACNLGNSVDYSGSRTLSF